MAEGQLQSWKSVRVQIQEKLKVVEKRLKEMYCSPKKPQKKKNYVLKKVKEPPSDNE